MKRLRDPISASIFFLLGITLTSVIYYFSEDEKSTINYLAYFGTFTTIYGLLITYAQIVGIREQSILTDLKVEESLNRTHKILSISKLSKSIKLVQEIQGYLRHSKLESAVIRLKDLKNILIQLKYNNGIDEFINSDQHKDCLTNISVNTNNINQQLAGTKTGINVRKIISDLEIAENHLVEIEGHLKYKENE